MIAIFSVNNNYTRSGDPEFVIYLMIHRKQQSIKRNCVVHIHMLFLQQESIKRNFMSVVIILFFNNSRRGITVVSIYIIVSQLKGTQRGLPKG